MSGNNNWGGKRAGAGRPRNEDAPRGKHSIYCTAQELLQVRNYLQQLRTGKQRVLVIAWDTPYPFDCMDAATIDSIDYVECEDFRDGSKLYLHYISLDKINGISIDDDNATISYCAYADNDASICRNYRYIDIYNKR